jgi:hypothetical protein
MGHSMETHTHGWRKNARFQLLGLVALVRHWVGIISPSSQLSSSQLHYTTK